MSYTLSQLAEQLNGELVAEDDQTISGVADLGSATSSDASYFAVSRYGGTRNYELAFKETQAGVVIINRKYSPPEGKPVLRVDNPSVAFQILIELFNKPIQSGFSGVHPSAVVHPSAKIGTNVTIGPFVVIDQSTTIGDNTTVCAHVSIGAECLIGTDCIIHPNVTIREGCTLGDRNIIQPGTVIGGSGYGYETDYSTGRHTHQQQLGKVVCEDDVEIGANTTIDRARFQQTLIRRGTKIDNLVMIAHGCELGEDNLIVSQTGIAGSTKTGHRVVIAGQCGITGHIEIANDVIIAARSGVIATIKEPGQYYGEPARPKAEFWRHYMRLLGLEKLYKRVKELEKRLDEPT